MKAQTINENIRFHKSQSEEDFRDTLFNKPLPFEKVRPGDIAIDYNDEEYKVIDKIDKNASKQKIKNFFKKYSTCGWDPFEDDIDIEDGVIAVHGDELGYFGGPGNEVFSYGFDGAVAYRYSLQ